MYKFEIGRKFEETNFNLLQKNIPDFGTKRLQKYAVYDTNMRYFQAKIQKRRNTHRKQRI